MGVCSRVRMRACMGKDPLREAPPPLFVRVRANEKRGTEPKAPPPKG